MKGAKVSSNATSLPRRSDQLYAPFPAWRGDSAISNTVVFHKRLNQPGTIIQATFRGWSSRRMKNKCCNQPTAAIVIQATVRGWMCRMKLQVDNIQKRLTSIQSQHQCELRQIEEHKKREMRRVYKELSSDAKIQQELERANKIYQKLLKAVAKREEERDAKHQRTLRRIEKEQEARDETHLHGAERKGTRAGCNTKGNE
jgi:IQ calmodulin-binding motif